MKVKNTQYRTSLPPIELQKILLRLEEGESFSEIITSSQSIESFRNQVYSFLHHEGIKHHFKISRNANELTYHRLQVTKRAPLINQDKIELQALQQLAKESQEIKLPKETLHLPKMEPEAQTLIQKARINLLQALDSGEITEDEFFPIIHELERINRDEISKGIH